MVSIMLGCCLVSCGVHILGDEGEWLGERIGVAADKLRHSGQAELVVSYAPESGINQRYSIGIGKSVWCPRPPCYENQGALTVEVERGRHGSTTYHMRFVAVPKPLEIHKVGEATAIVLRKNGDSIELVELR
ncbi:MAG: hypothetical protein ACREBE_23650 [bacterium]